MSHESVKVKTFTCECGTDYGTSKSRIGCRKTHKIVRADSVTADDTTPKKTPNSSSLKRNIFPVEDDSPKRLKADFVTRDEFQKELDHLRKQMSYSKNQNDEIEVFKYYCPRCKQTFKSVEESESHDLTCFIENGLIVKKTRKLIVSALIQDYSKELTKSLLGKLNLKADSDEDIIGENEKECQSSQARVPEVKKLGKRK